jgi:hypothetical protein
MMGVKRGLIGGVGQVDTRAFQKVVVLGISCLFLGLGACTKGGSGLADTGVVIDVLGILLTPEEVVIPEGDSIQLVATGLKDDRTSQDVTRMVDWSSSNAEVALVNDDLDEEGVITGLTVGRATITATLGDIESVGLEVTVTDAQLLGLTVEPGSVNASVGDEVSLSAKAAFSDGSQSDASAQVRWITGDGAVAQLERGTLTAVGVGTTEIVAEWDGTQSNTVPVEVVKNAEADLRISKVTATTGDDYLVAELTLKNDGDADASSFWVDVWIDPSPTPTVGAYGDHYELVSHLGAGDSKTVYVTFDDLASGEHTIFGAVDGSFSVSESDESNNTNSASITIDETVVATPELSIDDFDYIADSESFYYYVEIANYSDIPAEDFYVDVWLNRSTSPAVGDDGDDYRFVAALGAWDTVVLDFLVEDTCYSCTSWTFVDSTDAVEEGDESDNLESMWVTTPDDDTGWW